jgi:hypothetical protein
MDASVDSRYNSHKIPTCVVQHLRFQLILSRPRIPLQRPTPHPSLAIKYFLTLHRWYSLKPKLAANARPNHLPGYWLVDVCYVERFLGSLIWVQGSTDGKASDLVLRAIGMKMCV